MNAAITRTTIRPLNPELNDSEGDFIPGRRAARGRFSPSTPTARLQGHGGERLPAGGIRTTSPSADCHLHSVRLVRKHRNYNLVRRNNRPTGSILHVHPPRNAHLVFAGLVYGIHLI